MSRPIRRRQRLAALTALLASIAGSGQATASAGEPAGYYNGVNTTSAAALRVTLHAVIDDHQRFPYTASSTDTWNILELAEEDPSNGSRIVDIYRNASYPKAGGGNSNYDREHVWPSSYGFPSDGGGNYPFSDCHALRLCNSSYNSARGNKPFRFCDPGCTEYTTDLTNGTGGGSGVYAGNSNWTSGFASFGTWETWMDRRGDVARAIMYMDIRYEGGTHGITGFSEPDLIATDSETLIVNSNTGNNESVAYMGILSVLQVWHEQDPVDERERARNDIVQSFQGNRNPFIDHPEWVAILYGGSSGPTGTPWINELHYDNDGADLGEFVEIAGPENFDLAGYRLLAYNGAGGNVYDTLDLTGTLPNESGCLGTLAFTFTGLQNGPDGIALVDAVDNVLEFWSYEGSFTATDGAAFGMTSTDLGVSEPANTPIGQSLQRIGSGTTADDFTWTGPVAASANSANTGQTFGDACTGPPTIPAPMNLVATSCAGVVDLTWDQVSTAAFTGYRVYRTTSPGGGYVEITTSPVVSEFYQDTGVTASTLYGYVVTTVDAIGGESVFSGEATVVAQGGGAPPALPWINEFHYDNNSSDTGEFIEIAGPAGLNLSGWTLIGYNGANGLSYDSVNLSGTIPDFGECRGVLSFDFTGLQNGSPDGIALVDNAGTLVEFISYEGAFTASGGPADGVFSDDIGVSEPGTTPIGWSLQRAGMGSSAADFATWQSAALSTRDAANTGQVFAGGCGGVFELYGCALNPAGSLTLLSGQPAVGTSFLVGVDNPLGTQTVGSITAVVVSLSPAIGFPCGLPLPGYGMASAGAVGELLVDLTPGIVVPPTLIGPAWAGAGQPSGIALGVPDECSLAGLELFMQGVVLDPIGPNTIGLTDAARIELAP